MEDEYALEDIEIVEADFMKPPARLSLLEFRGQWCVYVCVCIRVCVPLHSAVSSFLSLSCSRQAGKGVVGEARESGGHISIEDTLCFMGDPSH